jgi:hypothetical protein
MYQHLNLENIWPRVRRFGLDIDPVNGAMTLAKLPGPPRKIVSIPGSQTEEPISAGIAVGSNGIIYVSDPKCGLVFTVDPFSGETAPLHCVCTSGSESKDDQSKDDQSKDLRGLGLAFQACRNRLLIADTKNCRILVVDPSQERVIDVWGQPWPYDPPQPCSDRGGLNGPTHLACDRAGNAFVIDALLRDQVKNEVSARVLKLTRDGVVTGVSFQCDGANPVHIAVSKLKMASSKTLQELVFVLAIASMELQLIVFDTDGNRIVSPTRLLRPDQGSGVGYGFVSKTYVRNPKENRAAIAEELRSLVTAFTVIDDTAIVSIASSPPRIWCFDVAELLAKGSAFVPVPSWLPLYNGPAVAMGVRGNPVEKHSSADVLLFAGPGRDLFALPSREAYRTQGAFLAGPFKGNRGLVTLWHRLRIDGKMTANEHMQMFTLSRSETKSGWKEPVRLRLNRIPTWFRIETQPDMFDQMGFSFDIEKELEPEADEFFPVRRVGSSSDSVVPERTPANQWFSIPENQFDGLINNFGGTSDDPCDQLWIFGLVAGDGITSPAIRQVRLEHDEDGWLSSLPEIYQRDPYSRVFTRSLLALFESGFEDVTESIERLSTLFSAHGMFARYGRHSEEVDWLRMALALPTTVRSGDSHLDRVRSVQSFADGPYWLARRGTPEGLRRLIWLATGVEVVIDEQGQGEIPSVVGIPQSNDPEKLDESSIGTFDSQILGYSTLFDPENPQPRRPDDFAHHFTVRGYESDLNAPEVQTLLEQAVSQLAPAHNTWSVQIIRPLARVGIQARLGIDTVVAPIHPADPMTIGESAGSDFQIDPSLLPPTVGGAHLNNTILM